MQESTPPPKTNVQKSLVTIDLKFMLVEHPCKNQGPAYISDYSASWPKIELDSNDFV